VGVKNRKLNTAALLNRYIYLIRLEMIVCILTATLESIQIVLFHRLMDEWMDGSDSTRQGKRYPHT